MIYRIYGDFGSLNSEEYEWLTIYDPSLFNTTDPRYRDDNRWLYACYDINLTKEMGAAGTLDFTIPPTHILYNRFFILGTTIWVTVDGRSVWFGRVLSIKKDFELNMTVSCEGALAWLNDILIRPNVIFDMTEDLWDGKIGSEHIRAYKQRMYPGEYYFRTIIEEYNKRCSPKRRIQVGKINSELYCMKEAMFGGSEDYRTALSELNNIISGDEKSMLYVDYMGPSVGVVDVSQGIWNNPAATIQYGLNLTDHSTSEDGSDIFTRLIPLDKDKHGIHGADSSGHETDYVDGQNTNKYGIIEKTLNLNGELDEDEMYRQGQILIHDMDQSTYGLKELNLKAVDLSRINGRYQYIDVGDTISIVSASHLIGGRFNCMKVNFSIDTPSDTTYMFVPAGTPSLRHFSKGISKKVGSNEGTDKKTSMVSSETAFEEEEAPTQFFKAEPDTELGETAHVIAVCGNRMEHYTISETDEGKFNFNSFYTSLPIDNS